MATWPLPDTFDELTQTTFGVEGNCWQTCIAAILRIDPATLPAALTLPCPAAEPVACWTARPVTLAVPSPSPVTA